MNSILYFLGQQISPVDSIAKHMNPQAEIHNLYWWIALVIVALVGIAFFVLKHFFRGVFLDGKPKPKVYIIEGDNKNESARFRKAEIIDVDKVVTQHLQQKMSALDAKFQALCLDPFQDERMFFPGTREAASNYNADVESYKEGMRIYYQRLFKEETISAFMKKIDFALYAKGKKVCQDLIITIVIDGDNNHVYSEDSYHTITDKKDIAPNPDFSSYLYTDKCAPYYFPNDQEDYVYGEWQLQKQPVVSHYECTSLVSGFPNQGIIPSIYVDIRYVQTININWTINGADIPEKGISGKLLVIVGE